MTEAPRRPSGGNPGSNSGPAAEGPNRARTPWLIYAAALAALLWVFHDISWKTILGQIKSIDARWLVPAIAADVLSYYCQGIRWHYLLRPAGNLSSWKSTQAIYVGLFVNEILPMRLGEVAAAFLAGLWLRLPISQVLPSMLIGRLLDGVWLALAVSLLLVIVPLPGNLEWAGNLFGIAVAIGVALFLLLLLPRVRRFIAGETPPPPGAGFGGKLRGWFTDLVHGIHEIRQPRVLIASAVASFGVLLFQTLAFCSVVAAYHLPVSVLAGVAVFLIVHLGTAIPNAPANVGSFQLFTVLGLSLFGVEKDLAAGFSAGVFLVLTVPLWLIGFLALSRTGLTLRSIRQQLRSGI
ncbi:MAG: flippase-like domain-containing protein [Bryobacterales bacterium]|nr:flippase-like domain-containing protein [Bryobacterales bacterium]